MTENHQDALFLEWQGREEIAESAIQIIGKLYCVSSENEKLSLECCRPGFF